MRQRFRKLTGSLSIRQFHRQQHFEDASGLQGGEDAAPLFDCIFTAGLYHDRISDIYVPFTRDCFPDGVGKTQSISEIINITPNFCKTLRSRSRSKSFERRPILRSF